jgi:hypothetical protein
MLNALSFAPVRCKLNCSISPRIFIINSIKPLDLLLPECAIATRLAAGLKIAATAKNQKIMKG